MQDYPPEKGQSHENPTGSHGEVEYHTGMGLGVGSGILTPIPIPAQNSGDGDRDMGKDPVLIPGIMLSMKMLLQD